MANKVILIGNVGKDAPQVKEFDWGKIATFTLATTERGYKTKDGKQIPDTTDWHSVVVRGGLANVVEKYVKSGTKVYVEGKIKYRSYEAKDGTKKYVTEIAVDNLELLGSKGDNQKSPTPQQQYQPQQVQQPQPQQMQFNAPQDDGLPF